MNGVLARDFQDGDLIQNVAVNGSVDTSKPGTYTLTYLVLDASGESASATQTVTVTATKPTLDTSKIPTTINVGDQININDVSAASKYGDVTVSVVGNVDTTAAGQNSLVYTATDKFGQTTTETVTVNVQEQSTETSTNSDPASAQEPTAPAAGSSASEPSQSTISE